MQLIEDACDPGVFGQQFFYSYGTDITLTQQRFTALSESSSGDQKPQWARADKRFFWNRHLTQPFTGSCSYAGPVLKAGQTLTCALHEVHVLLLAHIN